MVQPKVSVVIVAYNSRGSIHACIDSVLEQDYRDREVVVMDNASVDGTAALIAERYPEVKLIPSDRNLGFAGGCNRALQEAQGEYVAFLNDDAEADRRWMGELLGPLERDASIGLTTPKILVPGGRTINTCGNHTHYSGLTFCRGYGQDHREFNSHAFVGAISGCSFMVRRATWEELGGFDEDFFTYLEDTDLSWRALARGLHLAYVPTAIVYHRYADAIPPRKYFFLERNRHALLLKSFGLRSLFLLSPALLGAEGLAWGYALQHGRRYVKAKAAANLATLSNWRRHRAKYASLRPARRISEVDLLHRLSDEIPTASLGGGGSPSPTASQLLATFNGLSRATRRRASPRMR